MIAGYLQSRSEVNLLQADNLRMAVRLSVPGLCMCVVHTLFVVLHASCLCCAYVPRTLLNMNFVLTHNLRLLTYVPRTCCNYELCTYALW